MNIGILGAGTMGAALAPRLARSGHGVLVGTRDVKKEWAYAHLSLGSYQTAADFGDLAILALPWPVGLEVLGGITLAQGRILVDVSNSETPSRMIDSCGLDPVDAGGLAMARYLEPFAMLTVGLVRDQGWGPTGVAWRLMRRRSS